MKMDTQYLKDLIAQPSITPRDHGCKDIIARYLNLSPLDLSISDTANYYFETKSDGPLLLFLGHTDVVNPGAYSSWKTPPFELHTIEEQLYGRGLVDMKGAIWAFSHVMKHTNSDLRLGMLLTSDEEGTGINGIPAIIPKLAKNHIIPSWLLVGEPTSQDQVGDTYKTARRGSAHFQLSIKGKQGHTAYPHLAKNPCNKLTAFFQQLSQLSQLLPECDLSIYHLSTNSSVENMIPQSVTIKINLRYHLMSDYELTLKTLKVIDPELKCRISAQPYSSKENLLPSIIEQVSLDVLGIHANPSVLGGTSDARWFESICPNIIEYGLKNKTAHQCNESCSYQDLLTLTHLYQHFVKSLSATLKTNSESTPDMVIMDQ
jgi:succinyl-diaminopimelate desuccinylase